VENEILRAGSEELIDDTSAERRVSLSDGVFYSM
jgi:hypothetical protein